jgi:probable F420-dependent oxidoreductase
VTSTIELVTTVLILPQRQTVLVAKQAAEIALLSENRLRLGVGTGWNEVEYQALNEEFTNRGRRQEEQVELMRMLWANDAFSFDGRYHTVDRAGINPRPTQPVPIWFGGSAPALIERCARLGDGWMPLGGANDKSRALLDQIRTKRAEYGKSMDDFGVQAQARWAGGNPDRWKQHFDTWADIGATHMAVATHHAGPTDVDGHLARMAEYRAAVGG